MEQAWQRRQAKLPQTEESWNRLMAELDRAEELERRQDLINQERTVQEAKRIIAGEG